MEREIVGHMQRGNQWSYSDPMLVSPQLRIWTEDRHPELNRSQRKAVDEIFISREKIVGLDGVAGAGKTTTLSVVREGAEAQGYRVEGFAPTSRAAHKLAEAGMETSTLQRHLAKGHDELQSRGLVSKQEYPVRTLVPRQEMTGADRSWAQQYKVDDILRYSRSSKETGIEKGDYARVLAVNAKANILTVVRGNGEQTTYDPRRQVGVSVYREQERKFSVGDRVQFTAPPSHDMKIANRDLGTVESIGRDGTMRLRLDNERHLDFNPQHHPHLDHGYAVTSYSSQGQTAERVLVNVDTQLAAKDCSTAAWPMSRSRAVNLAHRYLPTVWRSCRRRWGMMFRTRAPISRFFGSVAAERSWE